MQIRNQFLECDLRILLWCSKSRYYPQWRSLVRNISRSGDGYLQLFLPLISLLFQADKGLVFLQLVLLAFLIERPVYWVLKNTLRRRRPPEVVADFTSLVVASDQFSFPSGHTMAAFTLAGLSVLYWGLDVWIIYCWATAVGCSRVLLGVHFPSDILAGATLGSLLALFSFWLMSIL